jgi:hypothetical protein
MEELIKVSSVCIYVSATSVFPCDENGQPNYEDQKLFSDLSSEWFQNLSNEDKELINQLIESNKKN